MAEIYLATGCLNTIETAANQSRAELITVI